MMTAGVKPPVKNVSIWGAAYSMRTRHRPKVAGFSEACYWQKQSGRATLRAYQGIEE
jgi:hypothetical protein